MVEDKGVELYDGDRQMPQACASGFVEPELYQEIGEKEIIHYNHQRGFDNG